MNKHVGLLINFGGETLIEGLRRVVNDLPPATSMRLRVNQPGSLDGQLLCNNSWETAASRGSAE